MAISVWTNPPRTWATSELVTASIGNTHWRDQMIALKVGIDAHCQGRLTLTTGVPVTTSDVTAATTLYFTPYGGDRISLFNTSGSYWETGTFTERSLSLSGLTANLPHDVFIYDSAGTLTLEAVAWTNDTARATSLATQNGVYVKSGALGRRYLGTFRTTGTTGQTEDTFAKRYVWNYYNRVLRALRRLESTGSWTYTTATPRQANGSTANQLDIVVGVAEVALEVTLLAMSSNSSADIPRAVGIGEDLVASWMQTQLTPNMGVSAPNFVVPHVASIRHYPAIGRHFYAWCEVSTATGTTTWYGNNAAVGGATGGQAGLIGSIEG